MKWCQNLFFLVFSFHYRIQCLMCSPILHVKCCIFGIHFFICYVSYFMNNFHVSYSYQMLHIQSFEFHVLNTTKITISPSFKFDYFVAYITSRGVCLSKRLHVMSFYISYLFFFRFEKKKNVSCLLLHIAHHVLVIFHSLFHV